MTGAVRAVVTLTPAEDEEFAGLRPEIEVEAAELGLAAPAVNGEAANGLPGFESSWRRHGITNPQCAGATHRVAGWRVSAPRWARRT